MLIVVEGCVGAGKSTVAKGLAALRGSQLLLEDFESNPFLSAFYKDPVPNAMETEFTFLLLHYHQLKGHAELALEQELIADFHLRKDLLYADLNLTEPRAKKAFRDLYGLCVDKVSQPSLMICLSAPTDLIIDRILQRNRTIELEVDSDYYSAVNLAYEDLFGSYSGAKLRIPMDEWDFVKDPTRFAKLDLLVNQELKG